MEEQKPSPKFDPEKTAALLVRMKKLKAELNSIIISDKELRRDWIKQYISNLN